MAEQTSPVLQVKDLKVTVKTEQGKLPLVHSIDFELMPGRVLGLVGESGSGKTVTSLALMQMLDRKASEVEGSIRLNGRELNGRKEEDMRRVRGKEMALIMQNPMNAFSPVYSIGTQFIETIRTHTGLSKKQAAELACSAMADVNLPHPSELLRKYPFELSGGMLQRVMIALSVCLNPSLIIADEPTTALDVTNQLQVLRLLDRVRQDHGTAILLISHDLGVIAEMADDVAVMQQGRIVEQADVFELFDHPKHAYTQTLLAARPMLQISPEMTHCIWS
ncbi:nickel transport system ATP-binding protein [Paenibacillus mucilaginosus]|uniref:nickel import ATP-binding protein NikD n=1 Tax=Paenibacillus mucilaginosus TaxID=61624 RepID=UPI003D1D2B6A